MEQYLNQVALVSRYIKIAGGILCFATFAVYYELAWYKVLDGYWLNKLFSYGEFLGLGLLFLGMFYEENKVKTKYLIYNTLSVFFFSLILVYGFQDIVVYGFNNDIFEIKIVLITLFKEDTIKGILEGYNKLMVTLIITSVLCFLFRLFSHK